MAEIFHHGLRMYTRLLDEPKYSDFTLICGDHEWNVHKLVLCTQSSVFAKACDGRFKEAESGKMQLQGDADVVDTMIKFLYTFAYVDNHISEHDRMPFSIHAFTIADQYDIIPMKEQAAKRFTELTHGTPAADAFSHAVELIYRNTLDREGLEHKLRQDAVEYAWTNYHELMGNDTGFKRVLDEVVGFGSSMVAFQMEQREPTAFATKGAKDYGCSSCGYAWSEDLPEKLKNRMKRKKASRKIPEECPDCGDDDSVYLA